MSVKGWNSTRLGKWTARIGASVVLSVVLCGCDKNAATTSPPGGGSSSASTTTSDGSGTAKKTPLEQPGDETRSVKVKAVTVAEYEKIVESLKGNVVVVDFWATFCVPCMQKFSHTVDLQHKYADKGVKVISFNMDDVVNHERVVKFLNEKQATILNLSSTEGSADEVWLGLNIEGGALPHFKLYGKDGQLIRTFGGDVDASFSHADIEAAVEEALK